MDQSRAIGVIPAFVGLLLLALVPARIPHPSEIASLDPLTWYDFLPLVAQVAGGLGMLSLGAAFLMRSSVLAFAFVPFTIVALVSVLIQFGRGDGPVSAILLLVFGLAVAGLLRWVEQRRRRHDAPTYPWQFRRK